MPILFGIDKARTLNEITICFFVCLEAILILDC